MAVGKGSIRRASSANSAVKEKKEVQAAPEQLAAEKPVEIKKAEPVTKKPAETKKAEPAAKKPAQEKERTYEVVSAIKSDLPVHLL